MRFIDTNVLLYRISQDPSETSKAEIAAQIMDDEDLCLSVQVLQEFYVQATRTNRPYPLAHEDAVALIESWGRYPVQAITRELLGQALATRERWQISYWDAAIIEAARILQCRQVFSEDLKHGENYGGVQVVNPFAC